MPGAAEVVLGFNLAVASMSNPHCLVRQGALQRVAKGVTLWAARNQKQTFALCLQAAVGQQAGEISDDQLADAGGM